MSWFDQTPCYKPILFPPSSQLQRLHQALLSILAEYVFTLFTKAACLGQDLNPANVISLFNPTRRQNKGTIYLYFVFCLDFSLKPGMFPMVGANPETLALEASEQSTSKVCKKCDQSKILPGWGRWGASSGGPPSIWGRRLKKKGKIVKKAKAKYLNQLDRKEAGKLGLSIWKWMNIPEEKCSTLMYPVYQHWKMHTSALCLLKMPGRDHICHKHHKQRLCKIIIIWVKVHSVNVF